jgi:hypothetical protein
MPCPIDMKYDEVAKRYVARDGTKTQAFKTLAEYEKYADKIGCPKTKFAEGTTLVETGFLEFAARDPENQKKYDAMSGSWGGVQASESAISRGLYDLDYVKVAK